MKADRSGAGMTIQDIITRPRNEIDFLLVRAQQRVQQEVEAPQQRRRCVFDRLTKFGEFK
jgi:hypothetical protein